MSRKTAAIRLRGKVSRSECQGAGCRGDPLGAAGLAGLLAIFAPKATNQVPLVRARSQGKVHSGLLSEVPSRHDASICKVSVVPSEHPLGMFLPGSVSVFQKTGFAKKRRPVCAEHLDQVPRLLF
ncbi:hypothetical protein MPLDJ20_260044 [Mesorhizobium plurifarium]|uniref:Uncharacterized protein n=1 Tax=Mesorhizobium plurifarium TaxID=69974 RepID=A0A090F6P5_MESPL|nr:hypothetical protein MPLDJ20_260044 [Mesorhizobium plurifarium]